MNPLAPVRTSEDGSLTRDRGPYWAGRSRKMQQHLIQRWAAVYGS